METTKIQKYTQDYSDLGYGLVNTYHKSFFAADGRYTGKVVYYTYELNGVESKQYVNRGWCCRAMFADAEVAA